MIHIFTKPLKTINTASPWILAVGSSCHMTLFPQPGKMAPVSVLSHFYSHHTPSLPSLCCLSLPSVFPRPSVSLLLPPSLFTPVNSAQSYERSDMRAHTRCPLTLTETMNFILASSTVCQRRNCLAWIWSVQKPKSKALQIVLIMYKQLLNFSNKTESLLTLPVKQSPQMTPSKRE